MLMTHHNSLIDTSECVNRLVICQMLMWNHQTMCFLSVN